MKTFKIIYGLKERIKKQQELITRLRARLCGDNHDWVVISNKESITDPHTCETFRIITYQCRQCEAIRTERKY